MAQAHQALKEAASTLGGLADYCESNFKEANKQGGGDGDISSRDLRLVLDPSEEISGGPGLRQTAEFAVRALQVQLN